MLTRIDDATWLAFEAGPSVLSEPNVLRNPWTRMLPRSPSEEASSMLVSIESSSAELEADGRAQLAQVATALNEISRRIPPAINWVLQVDGHTDREPIRTALFPSNWELSSARAISVVQFFVAQGVPPERLSANGFGEFQPIDKGASPSANRRNRRIELKLTQR